MKNLMTMMVAVLCFPVFAAMAQVTDRFFYQAAETSDEQVAAALANHLNEEGKLLGEKVGAIAYTSAKKVGYPGSNLEAKVYVAKWFDIYGTQLNLNPQQFYTPAEIRSFALLDPANPGFPLLTAADLGQAVTTGAMPAVTSEATGATPAVKVTDPSVAADEGATPSEAQRQMELVAAAQVEQLRGELKEELAKGSKAQAATLTKIQASLQKLLDQNSKMPSIEALNAAKDAAKQAVADAAAATAPDMIDTRITKALAPKVDEMRTEMTNEVATKVSTATFSLSKQISSLKMWLLGVAALVAAIAFYLVYAGWMNRKTKAMAIRLSSEVFGNGDEPTMRQRLDDVAATVVASKEVKFLQNFPATAMLQRCGIGEFVTLDVMYGNQELKLRLEILPNGMVQTNLRRGAPGTNHAHEMTPPMLMKRFTEAKMVEAIAMGRLLPERDDSDNVVLMPHRRAVG